MSTARKILERLENIEKLLANMSPSPVQSFMPGGADWRLNASDEQVREYNRQKGVERRRAGRLSSRHERKTAPETKRRSTV